MASFDYEFNNMHAACEDQSGNDVVILEYAQVSNNVSVNQPTINCNVFEPWPNILDLPCGIEANPSINQIPLVYTIGNVSNNYLDQPNEDMMAPGNTIFLINEAITNPLTNNSNALTLLVDTPLDNCDQPVSAAAPFHGFVEQPELNSENGALFHNERTAILDRTIGAINVTQFDGTISSNFVSNITMAKTTLTPSDATGPQDSDFSESILCELFLSIMTSKISYIFIIINLFYLSQVRCLMKSRISNKQTVWVINQLKRHNPKKKRSICVRKRCQVRTKCMGGVTSVHLAIILLTTKPI